MKKNFDMLKNIYRHFYFISYSETENWYKDKDLKSYYGFYTLSALLTLLVIVPYYLFLKKILNCLNTKTALSGLLIILFNYILYKILINKNVESQRKIFYSNEVFVKNIRIISFCH